MKKRKEKQKKDKGNYLLITGVIIGLFGGMIIGMMVQQAIFVSAVAEVGRSLEGSTFDIEIDINETHMVDRIIDNFLPVFNLTEEQEASLR